MDVVPNTLAWGMRAGFRAYLRGLDDLREESRGVRYDPGAERWLFRLDDPDTHLRFVAHGGVLDIAIRSPRVVQTGDGAVMVHGPGEPIARLLGEAVIDAEGRVTYQDVALTWEGASLFGGVYGPWARMDPVLLERR